MRSRSALVAASGATLVCALLVTTAQTVPRGLGGDRFRGVIRDAVQLVLVTLAVTVVAVSLRREVLDPLDPLTLVMAPLVGAAGAVPGLEPLARPTTPRLAVGS